MSIPFERLSHRRQPWSNRVELRSKFKQLRRGDARLHACVLIMLVCQTQLGQRRPGDVNDHVFISIQMKLFSFSEDLLIYDHLKIHQVYVVIGRSTVSRSSLRSSYVRIIVQTKK